MESKIIWKKAKQSFVFAYEFASEVLAKKIILTAQEYNRLLDQLKQWVLVLDDMIEHVSDIEMVKDSQVYRDKINVALQQLEERKNK